MSTAHMEFNAFHPKKKIYEMWRDQAMSLRWVHFGNHLPKMLVSCLPKATLGTVCMFNMHIPRVRDFQMTSTVNAL